jgi:enamine deaminase RidA (YjgF/YER057c/UK114 family)
MQSAKDRAKSHTAEDSMAGSVEKKLASIGVVLPSPASPVANYVPFVRTGNTLVVSGQLCFDMDGKLSVKGQLGDGVSVEDGQKAARACAVNLLAQLKAALGDLDKVTRVVRLGGFINSAAGFTDGPKVMNGASDLMVEAFGDKGRHARSTVGVAALPADAAVEVEGLFEVSSA